MPVASNHESRLPGVQGAAAVPRAQGVDPRDEIRRARATQNLRDAGDLLLLIFVDVLFLRWEAATIPLMTRHDTLLLLLLFHVAVLGHLLLARRIPSWKARWIARTWTATERERLVRSRQSD